MQTNGNEELSELDNWDPRKDAFLRKDFNSYTHGVGKDFSRREKEGTEVKLFVKGIPNELTQEGLKNLFLEFGEILSVKKCTSKFPEQGITFGFVSYRTIGEALAAIKKLDGFQITSKFHLKVRIALSDEERSKEKKKRQEEAAFLNSLPGRSTSPGLASSDKENKPQELNSRASDWVAQKPYRGDGPKTSTPEGSVGTGDSCSEGEEMVRAKGRERGPGLDRSWASDSPGTGLGRGLLSISTCQPGDKRIPPLCGDDHLNTTMQPLIQVRDSLKITLSGDQNGRRHVEATANQVDVPEYPDESADMDSEYSPMPYLDRYRDAPYEGPAHYSTPRHYTPYYQPRPFGYRPYHRPPRHHLFHGPPYFQYYGRPRFPHGGPHFQHGGPRFLYQGARPHRPQWSPRLNHSHQDFPRPTSPRASDREVTLKSPRSSQGSEMNDSVAMTSDAGSVTSEKVKLPCTYCGKLGSSKCKNCKSPYCSRPCQQKDWPSHKSQCNKIRESNKDEEEFAKRFDFSIDDNLITACQNALGGDEKEQVETGVQVGEKLTVPCCQLALNKVVQGVISWVESPCRLWFHQANEETIQGFMDLNTKLKEGGQPVLTQLVKGDYVAALSKEYKTWNRAQVLSVDGLEKVTVHFIDHGNSDKVSRDCLKEIDPSLLKLPAQAIPCTLAGFEDMVTWPGERLTVAQNLLNNLDMCDIEPMECRQGVYVISLKQSDGVSVNDMLMKALSTQTSSPGAEAVSTAPPVPIPLADQLPLASDTVKPGDHIWVYIVLVASPRSFKVQLCDKQKIATFQKFCVDLNQFYSSVAASPHQCSVGELVVAKFSEDNTWYRAKVLEICGESVKVMYVDFGNEEKVSVKDIRRAGDKCQSFPIQAVESALVGVQPVGKGQWSEDVLDLLQELEPIQAVVKSKAAKKLILDIYDEKSGSVSAYLVSKGLAQFDANTEGSSLVQPSVNVFMPEQVPDTEQPSAAVQNTKPSMVESSLQSPRAQASVQHQAAQTSITELPCSRLQPGQPTRALCQVVDEDGSFFVQSLAKENLDHLTLVSQMQELYEKRPAIPCTPAPGELVCANFEGAWCRAVVREILSDGQMKLYFVDYGNTSCLQVNVVQSLDETFCKIPAQAIRCVLQEGRNINWSKEAKSLLNSYILEQMLSVTLVEEVGNISYVHAVSEKGNVGEVLLSQNSVFAKAKFTPVQNSQATTDHVLRPAETNLPVTKLKQRQLTKAFCSVVEEDGSFYVQSLAEENRNALLTITQIDVMYKSRPTTNFIPVRGQLTCANYEESWCRAVVKDILPDGQVMLYFVDYGNTSCLPVNCTQSLDESFHETPAQAIRCVLEGSGSVNWSREMKSMLSERILEQVISVTLVSEVGGINHVRVLSDSGDVNSAVLSIVSRQVDTGCQSVATPKEGTVRLLYIPSFPKSLQLTAARLTPGKPTKAFCAVVNKDGTFYVQSCAEENKKYLAQLAKLHTEYQTRSFSNYSAIKDELLCAEYDGSWSRAVVEDILSDGTLRLNFVDYGNVSCLPAKCVQSLDEVFSKIPALAIRCCLQGSNKMNWSEETTSLLASHVLEQMLTVTMVEEVAGVSCVQVLSDRGEVTCSSVLSEASKSQSAGVITSRSPPAVTDQPTGPAEALLPVTKLPQGQPVNACCPVVEEDGSFYVQNLSEENMQNLTVISLVDSAYKSRPTVPFSPVRGQLICANYEGSWCRAVVRDILPVGQFKLYFVDYGNTSCLPANCAQSLDENFCKIPAQAVKCALDGHNKAHWSSANSLKLSEKLVEKAFTVTLVSTQGDTNYVKVISDLGEDVNSAVLLTTVESKQVIIRSSLGTAALQTKEADLVLMTILTPGEFYCVSPMAEELTGKVHSACVNQSPDPSYDPGLDHVCAAVYAQDNRFYRVVVVDKEVASGQYEVFYLDYGDNAVVQQSQLRKLPPGFTQPPCAFLCYIPGLVCGADQHWSPRAIEIIQSCSQQPVHVEVLAQNDGRHKVRLFHKGVDVGQMLQQSCQPAPIAAPTTTRAEPGAQSSGADAGASDAEVLRKQYDDLKKKLEALETMMALQNVQIF